MTRLLNLPALGLLSAGFLLGAWMSARPAPLAAQAESEATADGVELPMLKEDTAEKIKVAHTAVSVAQAAMEQEGLYMPAIRSKNAWAVFVGGVDAVADLEGGRGVDPVTFAGLHVGQATDEIAPSLGFDEMGRLTYKGKLVRIYSIDRMKQLEARGAAVLGASEGGRRSRERPCPSRRHAVDLDDVVGVATRIVPTERRMPRTALIRAAVALGANAAGNRATLEAGCVRGNGLPDTRRGREGSPDGIFYKTVGGRM